MQDDHVNCAIYIIYASSDVRFSNASYSIMRRGCYSWYSGKQLVCDITVRVAFLKHAYYLLSHTMSPDAAEVVSSWAVEWMLCCLRNIRLNREPLPWCMSA